MAGSLGPRPDHAIDPAILGGRGNPLISFMLMHEEDRGGLGVGALDHPVAPGGLSIGPSLDALRRYVFRPRSTIWASGPPVVQALQAGAGGRAESIEKSGQDR
jgi:hypothetical protein